jgi:C4-dicarboxylate-specific signal transduction histidine kinase
MHVSRYAIALLFVGAALLLSLLVHEYLPDGFLMFFISAVMLAGWFGRTSAGLFAVVVSMLAVDYYFITPYRTFVIERDLLPYLLAFLSSAVVTSRLESARRSAEEKQRGLQKAQAELAHLSRITTMGELAASIAHEINQPIGAMVTNGNAAARWLAQRPPNLEGAEEALDCIIRDGHRAAAVIGRIRSLLGKNSTPMVKVDLNDVIREALLLTAHEIDRRGIVVATDFAGDLPPILADRVQLQQVILNLIMNGMDAMTGMTDCAPRLQIKSSRKADCVLTQMLDCGSGLPAQADSIFEPFFTTKKDGIGMGLTISRSIIEAHGGRLWAEHASPHGAILNFTLPIGATAD